MQVVDRNLGNKDKLLSMGMLAAQVSFAAELRWR